MYVYARAPLRFREGLGRRRRRPEVARTVLRQNRTAAAAAAASARNRTPRGPGEVTRTWIRRKPRSDVSCEKSFGFEYENVDNYKTGGGFASVSAVRSTETYLTCLRDNAARSAVPDPFLYPSITYTFWKFSRTIRPIRS